MAYWLAWEEPRAVGDLVHVEKFFARNLGGLIRARTCAGPAREGKSRTPSMYADEKSDEAVVPRKRPNKGRQLPAEVVEGRASPKGNSRQAAVVRTLSRDATSIRLAAVRRTAGGFKPRARTTSDPREEPGALAAHAGICAGGEEQSSSLPRPWSLFHPQFDSIFWSIASTECGEIPSSTNPGISGDDTVSICISST